MRLETHSPESSKSLIFFLVFQIKKYNTPPMGPGLSMGIHLQVATILKTTLA